MELEVEKLAKKAQEAGENDLAIVLHTYLGSKCFGVGSEFAEYCQVFARQGIKHIESRNRRNN